jgi:hypothetical protein
LAHSLVNVEWQMFTKWKFSHGCNVPCLGGCNLKYIRFLGNLML